MHEGMNLGTEEGKSDGTLDGESEREGRIELYGSAVCEGETEGVGEIERGEGGSSEETIAGKSAFPPFRLPRLPLLLGPWAETR